MRASGHEDDTALSALHANAAWQQGVFAALVAVLDMCSSNSPVVDLQVTEMHVRLACRLLEINLNIRQAWRSQGDLSLPEERVPGDHIRYILFEFHVYIAHLRTVLPVLLTLLTSQEATHLHNAVAMGAGQLGRGDFAPPLGTQPFPLAAELPATIQEAEQEDHEASYAPDGGDVLEDTEALTVTPLTFKDVLSEDHLKTNGLGPGGAMLFPQTKKSGQVTQLFFDRVLLRKVLLHGSAEIELNKLVDKMSNKIVTPAKTPGEQSRTSRVRPSLVEASADFAFSQSEISSHLRRLGLP